MLQVKYIRIEQLKECCKATPKYWDIVERRADRNSMYPVLSMTEDGQYRVCCRVIVSSLLETIDVIVTKEEYDALEEISSDELRAYLPKRLSQT